MENYHKMRLFEVNCYLKHFIFLRPILDLQSQINLSVIRQKCESQTRRNKETKHAQFSGKRTFQGYWG